ncbi:MAG: hypothetical protein CML29_08315 [Rhizobiales bacterium]|nr:hypothetical protein [Hyphomicrobiales bacterium]MBA67554.1 hypothetical protein [Hyphomicrobiales bacterium]
MAAKDRENQVLPEPLFDVLGRVSGELRDVAMLIEQLEPMLSDGQSDEHLHSPEHMRLLQGIDLAVQKAKGLAAFLDCLGEELDVDHLIDITTALNLVTLADMKTRLRAAVESKNSAAIYQAASGDLDFF